MEKNKKLLFILKGYPRLSETFILQEIVALEAQGFDIHIMAMRHPHDDKTHTLVQQVKATVSYLPTHIFIELGRLYRAFKLYRHICPKHISMLRFVMLLLAQIGKEKSLKPLKRVAQALIMLAEKPEGFHHLHAHFIHTPAELAYYAHLLSGLPYTISAHAKDIWTSRKNDLARKLDKARWVTCCTEEGRGYLQQLTSTPVHLIYHGIDLKRFPLREPSLRKKSHEMKLCFVGRLVPKKGVDVLLKALSYLPRDLSWELVIAGGGELSSSLRKQAQHLKLNQRVKFLGSVTADDVKALLQNSDIFVLPCRVEADGDRDGIPNVLMEAISQGVPVVSTKLPGIQELLCEKSSLLVDPHDADQLKDALSTLMIDPELRYALAREAQEKLQKTFRLEQGIAQLAEKFEDTLSLRAADPRS